MVNGSPSRWISAAGPHRRLTNSRRGTHLF
jgi:hypothetical protein